MEVLSRAFIPTPHGEREIQLCLGDITRLSPHEKVDIIMVSAFVGDYSAIPGTVIGALKQNLGLNVQEIARHHKKEDLRVGFNCWISKPLENHFPFRQLVCFERLHHNRDQSMRESVEDMFRALFPAFNNENKSVITPLLMTGCQSESRTKMLKVMVSSATEWIRVGLPLQLFRVVIYSQTPSKLNSGDRELLQCFENMKKSIEKPVLIKEPQVLYDFYFVCTAQDKLLFDLVTSKLHEINKNLKCITLSDVDVKVETWKHDIHQIMRQCARIVPLLTEDFLKDVLCLDQYNVALCCNRSIKRNIIAPVCFARMVLPTYMAMVQWIDCRDQEAAQISSACNMLIENTDQESTHEELLYDVFISYCHRNASAAQTMLSSLHTQNKDLKIFFDYKELKSGANWQLTLYEAMDSSRSVVALLSKDYFQSHVCREEFSLALCRHLDKRKELELIVLLLEDVGPIKALTYLLPIRASSDFQTVANNTSVKLCEWLGFGVESNILSPVPNPIQIDEIMEQLREANFEKFYKFHEGEFVVSSSGMIPSLKENESETPEAAQNKCHVFISHSARNQKYAAFLSRSFNLINPNVKVHLKSHVTDTNAELEFLHSANVLVVILSKSYIQSPKEVEEFNVILSLGRRSKGHRHLYVIRLNELPPKPTYFHLVNVDTDLTDPVWEGMVKRVQNPDKIVSLDVRKEFSLARRHVEDKEMSFKDAEILALVKIFADIAWKLKTRGSLPGSDDDNLLHNIVDLQSHLQEEFGLQQGSEAPQNDPVILKETEELVHEERKDESGSSEQQCDHKSDQPDSLKENVPESSPQRSAPEPPPSPKAVPPKSFSSPPTSSLEKSSACIVL